MDAKLVEEEAKKVFQGIKSYLLSKHPFWGTVSVNLKFSLLKDAPSIAFTDCYSTVYFRPEALKLPPKELKFIVLHELLHVVLMHSQRRGKRDPYLWNLACDYAINSILVDEMKMEMPKTIPGLYDENFKNKPAEVIYIELLEKASKVKIYIVIPDLCDSSNSGCNNKVFEVTTSGTKEITDENKIKKILSGKENAVVIKTEIFNPTDLKKSNNPEGEVSRIKDIIAQAHLIQQKFGDKVKGDLPGSVWAFVKKIVEPKVPFDILLARYASEIIAGKSEFSYTPLNKRRYLEYGAVYPSISKEEIPKVVVAVDTSGSISNAELSLFAGAIKKMSTITPELTVITCDASIHQVIPPSQIESFLKSIKFAGRGGTSHIPVFEYIDKKIPNPDVVICLTDGYTDYPNKKPKYPVIWVLTPNHKTPPWGKVIVLKKDNSYLDDDY